MPDPALTASGATARLTNPLNHSVALSAIVTDNAGVLYDSLQMFDDGAHGDMISGDSIWGSYIRTPSSENLYSVAIRTEDLTQGSSRRLPYAVRFTTAGPVVCVGDTAYADPHWGASATFRLKVNNHWPQLSFPP